MCHVKSDKIIMFAVLLFLCTCTTLLYGASSNEIRSFPSGFKFGAATAAYQIEGGWNENGKSMSIWDHLTHKDPSFVYDGTNGDIAADSYHLYKNDVQMVKDLGLDFYRFSLSWTRILPNGFNNEINQAGLKYYEDLIDELLSNGIEPMVTLYHWDLPQKLQDLGGFANPLITDWFKDYAEVVFDKLGNKVKYWITINEPKQICYEGYGSDAKAPALNMSGIAEYVCAKNVLLSHAKVYHLYDNKFRSYQHGQIGISVSFTWYEPLSDSADDKHAALDARSFDWGQYTHPIFSRNGDFPIELKRNIGKKSAEQGYKKSRLPELTPACIQYIKGSSDFFGINTYTTKLVYRNSSINDMYAVPSYLDDMGAATVKDESWPQSQSDWLQSVPWGLYKILTEVRKLYDNPPVFITENGWSTAGGLCDDDRVQYYKSYLNAMLDAIADGSDVRLYTAWSLMDNFEWKNGYSEKFGLYEVDFNSPNRTRTARKSALVYKEIVRSKSLDKNYDLMENYLGCNQEDMKLN